MNQTDHKSKQNLYKPVNWVWRKTIKFGLVLILVLAVFFLIWGLLHDIIPVKSAADIQALKADRIVVEKEKRQMNIYAGNQKIVGFNISLGSSPIGHKQQKGDGKTPEGKYQISYKNSHSRYHLSLKVSYPNRADKFAARKKGVDPGSDIMIHGYPNYLPAFMGDFLLQGRDWTAGCIAVSNAEIELLWQLVDIGTQIEILP